MIVGVLKPSAHHRLAPSRTIQFSRTILIKFISNITTLYTFSELVVLGLSGTAQMYKIMVNECKVVIRPMKERCLYMAITISGYRLKTQRIVVYYYGKWMDYFWNRACV